jgi:hypothetical protein
LLFWIDVIGTVGLFPVDFGAVNLAVLAVRSPVKIGVANDHRGAIALNDGPVGENELPVRAFERSISNEQRSAKAKDGRRQPSRNSYREHGVTPVTIHQFAARAHPAFDTRVRLTGRDACPTIFREKRRGCIVNGQYKNNFIWDAVQCIVGARIRGGYGH